MLRQAARDDEDRVDADVVAGAGEALLELARGDRDPAQAMLVERECSGIGGGALLDLDKRQHLATPRDQIDLTAAHFHPLGEDPPAVKPQPPGGDGLGAAAALLGVTAVQSGAPSASARA